MAFQTPPPISNNISGALAVQAIANVLTRTGGGTTIFHYQAQLVDQSNFNDRGRPDYLGPDPGVFDSGIQYLPNPQNPLKGIFCRAPFQPIQEGAGIFLRAEVDLYLAADPGEVFKLDDKFPKRQDRFAIQGINYYAVAPTFPCMLGDATVLWKVSLSRERYPVGN